MKTKLRLTYLAGEGRRRWRKIYLGQSYYFDAGTGKTDTAAYRRAIESWEKLKVKLDGEASDTLRGQYMDCVSQWELVAQWSSTHGEEHWGKVAAMKLKELRGRLAQPELAPLDAADWFFNVVDPGASERLRKEYGLPERQPIPPGDNRVMRAVWDDRLREAARKAAPKADSIAENIKTFLASREAKVQAEQLSVSRLVALRVHLTAFEAWILNTEGTTSVKAINGPMLIKYKAEVDKECKARTAGHRLEAVKTWVKWAWANEIIDTLPRAFSTGELKIRRHTPTIKTFSVADVKVLLANASPRTRLYCLLGLNAGMYQVDISDLRREEIDMEARTITRKRSKTRHEENVPTVTYKLWDATVKLLEAQMAPEGERALVGENGRPLLVLGTDGKKTDAVRSAFARLLKKTKIAGSFKMLRKSGATLLRDSPYHDIVDLYLGHAAGKVSDQSYAKAALKRLGMGLAWLAKQFGVS
jgi:integrase